MFVAVGAVTLSPVGIVAGPLAVGLFVESASLLPTELNPPTDGVLGDDTGSDTLEEPGGPGEDE